MIAGKIFVLMQPWSFVTAFVTLAWTALGQPAATLPGTQPLTLEGDLSARMVEGIDRFLMREIEHSVPKRAAMWRRDFSSREAYEKSIAPNREHLRTSIGSVDARVSFKA